MITNHKYVYIAHITAISDNECTAYVPAFKELGYATEIKADSITNALDALNDKVVKILVECENTNKLPPDEVVKLKEQPEHGAFTLIQLDTAEYRRKHDNTLVRKSVTIPKYLNDEAVSYNANFSKILTDGLEKYCEIQRKDIYDNI